MISLSLVALGLSGFRRYTFDIFPAGGMLLRVNPCRSLCPFPKFLI
nr:MAG TPA: hypothetical protein [Inoviridae sp.]